MSDRDAEMTEKASFILAKKELKLLFKSKRRIFLLMITPLIILLIGVIAVGSVSFIDNDVQPVQISVIDENPSNYTSQLNTLYSNIEDTEIKQISQSYAEVLESKNFKVLIYFPSNFSSQINSDTPAQMDLLYNGNSSEYQRIAIQIFQLTNSYEQQLLVQDNPNVEFDRLQPDLIELEEEDTGGLSEEIASSIFIIPVYIIFFVVIPPISLIMISVTQEREMKTLETLLLQPVKRNSIISGKILYGMSIVGIVLLLDILAVAIDIALITFFLDLDTSEGGIGDIIDQFTDLIGIDIILYFFATIILISTLVVGLSVLLSLIAKDEREANLISSVVPLLMISIIIIVQAVDVIGLSFPVQLTMTMVPLLGILVALYIILVAGSIGLLGVVGMVSQLFWIYITIRFAARLSESESILELNASKLFQEIKNMLLFR